MTNGGIILFKNNAEKNRSLKILKKYNIYGYKVFEIKKLNSKNFFLRIQIKSFYNFNSKINKKISKKEVVKKLSYEKNNLKLMKKNINNNFYFFKSQMTFIKTTGKHIFEGDLLIKNSFIKKQKIENRNIFLVVKDFFKK